VSRDALRSHADGGNAAAERPEDGGAPDETAPQHVSRAPETPAEPAAGAPLDRLAELIAAEVSPRRVLHLGCGSGALVAALRERGIEAWGVDESGQSIQAVPQPLQQFCRLASYTDELGRDYDLVVCLDVLEHLPADRAERAVENLARHTEAVVFAAGLDVEDPDYEARPPERWASLFARNGLYRNVDSEVDTVIPHATAFVRRADAPLAVARDYERWHWRHRLERRGLQERLQTSREELAAERAEATALRDDVEVLERDAAEARSHVADLQAQVAELRSHVAELRSRAAELRSRAAAAEASLAEWETWAQSPAVKPLLQLAALPARAAPEGSRRRRLVRAIRRGRPPVGDAASAEEEPSGGERAHPPPAATRAVLFLSGCPGDAMRYRCDHQAEQLRLLGVSADVAVHGEIDLDDAARAYAAFVLHRVPWGADVARLARRVREASRPLLFDTDDLVFDPAVERPAFRPEAVSGPRLDRAGIERLRRALVESDAVLVSTEPLRQRAAQLHRRVAVSPNVVSSEMVERAETLERRAAEGVVTIGYFSGTPTHERDFLEAADALLSTLARYDHVRLLLVGYLAVDERFGPFADRVERLAFQQWERLPALLARTDVNLAPLETGDPFAEAKSPLKYVEAALQGVPTVASAQPAFSEAIDDGRTGLLASTPEEWRDALARLVESEELRRELGQAARADVLATRTTLAHARELRSALLELVPPPARHPRVELVLSGGPGDEALPGLAEALSGRPVDVRLRRAQDEPAAGLDATVAGDAATALAAGTPLRFVLAAEDDAPAAAAQLRGEPVGLICHGAASADELSAAAGRPVDSIGPLDDPGTAGAALSAVLSAACFVRATAE
jgi:glycosyltransferase involved in cell wall biosynthesis/SAM-dependent methyltransferase